MYLLGEPVTEEKGEEKTGNIKDDKYKLVLCLKI
jgi:hypothetical protein